jgi:hypothetical protein
VDDDMMMMNDDDSFSNQVGEDALCPLFSAVGG